MDHMILGSTGGQLIYIAPSTAILAELSWVLRTLGFQQVAYFAVTADGYSREHALDL